MKNNKCPQCGAPRDPNASQCKYCGEKFTVLQPDVHRQNSQAPKFVQPMYPPNQFQPANATWTNERNSTFLAI